ncbi:hypothetical protein KAR91_56880 [Candidatus Pacearchaeota archaeon]|nr:hypothetical protein [Candidatus Pacearchaeota archaeon]
MLRPYHVIGGVYIAPGAAGGIALIDFITGVVTAQDLVDQAITDTATLYFALSVKCKSFFLTDVTMWYVDNTNVDDLAEMYLLEGANADDGMQDQKARWRDINGIAEGISAPVSGLNISFYLDTPGRLYFLQNWSTAVANNNHVDDRWYLRIDGYTFHRVGG